MNNENELEIHQGYRELQEQHDQLLSKYKAAQDLVSDIVGFDRDNGVHDVGTMVDRIDALLADQMPVPQQTNWPDQCPITRRDFFMEIDGVPTYGGPYDSYTIPEMLGTPDQPLHERELFVHRYDHDLGGWRDDECIPMRIIREDVLWELEEKAEKALEPRITQPARIGGVVFQPGIKVASVIEAAYRAAEDHEPNPAAFQALRAAIAPEQSGDRTITEGQEFELTTVLQSIANGFSDDPAHDAAALLKRIAGEVPWTGGSFQGGEPCATASPSSNEG
ncbi:hypothetical protein [Aeromonas enteropelogenes]|uniref:hypothetical protein n=1 Tax=Aeromonas enteropelogenes TaxID=29489 RepID=UPI003BA1D3CB